MEKFKSNFSDQNFSDKVISNIFHERGREFFSKKVQETLEWSEKGGPLPNTRLFIRNITGKVDLKPEEFSVLKREIDKEIKKIGKAEKIKKEKTALPSKEAVSVETKKPIFSEKEKADMIEDSQKLALKELERSGNIDPNEL